MLGTLRRQFVLSHILPVLVVIPLLGLALAYVLETQVVLPAWPRIFKRRAGWSRRLRAVGPTYGSIQPKHKHWRRVSASA
jgi:hypothetical protein